MVDDLLDLLDAHVHQVGTDIMHDPLDNLATNEGSNDRHLVACLCQDISRDLVDGVAHRLDARVRHEVLGLLEEELACLALDGGFAAASGCAVAPGVVPATASAAAAAASDDDASLTAAVARETLGLSTPMMATAEAAALVVCMAAIAEMKRA